MHTKAQQVQSTSYLSGHDELMIDDVIGRVTHAEQSTRRMQVTRHSCPQIDVLA